MSYASLLEALPDAAVLLDTLGEVQYWNAAAEHLFGMPPHRATPHGPVVAPAVAIETRQHLTEVLHGEDWDGDFDVTRVDGQRLHLHGHASAVRSATGEITGVLTVSRVHDEHATHAITESGPYAAEILDSMSAHVAVLDPDGQVRDVNRAWRAFAVDNAGDHDVAQSTGVGINYVQLCRTATGTNAEGADLAADGIEDVLRGRRSSFMLEYPCDSATESRWFAMHVTPLKSRGGGAVVAHYDITARKQAEQAAALQRQRTELALTAAHMGVWTLDLATNQVHWTAEVYRIVGVDEFDGTLAGWNRLVHPDDLPGVMARFEEAVPRRMPFTSEFRIVRPSGEVRWLANVAQVESDPAGHAIAVVGTVQDITARRRSAWALTAYNGILELIAMGAGLPDILDAVVHLVEEQLPGSLCSILLVDRAKGKLYLGSGPSLPTTYNQAIDGVPIGPKSGSCGTAAHRGSIVAVTDIRTDPLWEDYRTVALAHGLHSCVSVPIVSSGNVPGHEKGEVIGTFALYNRAPGEFDRLTLSILSGAEELVRRALQIDRDEAAADADADDGSTRLIEAAHLAGVAIERDHAAQAIRDSDERFRAVFDSTPSVIVMTDLDGRFLFVNRAATEFFGRPREEWIGRRAKEVLPSALGSLTDASLALQSSTSSPEEQIRVELSSGRIATVLATRMPLRHGDGTVYAMCGILRDVTEEQRLAAQVQHTQKMEAVGQLASGVAHDFNNLLTVIISYTEMLLAESALDDEQREYLSEVLGAGERATELTSQLLAFSRKAFVEPRVLDPNQVIESSARMLRRLLGEPVQLRTELAVVPPVRVDSGQLEQLLMNLALNARDAMPHGGNLVVRSGTCVLAAPLRTLIGELPAGTYAEIIVRDTGAGMSPEVQARIFEPFFTTKQPGKGTGLGLATVYGIVQQAGGGLLVQSTVGVGTTFRLLFPAAAEPITLVHEGLHEMHAGGRETILVVEDELGVRRVVATVLMRQGYRVLVAETGAEALALANTHAGTIDLLLTDVVMPDAGGRALAEQIRARLPDIRVLYMSGYSDDAMLRAGGEAAEDALLPKPFAPATLVQRVREVLDAEG